MKFDPKTHLTELLGAALEQVAPNTEISIEIARSKQAEHGDFATNLALQIAKKIGLPPKQAAQRLIDALPGSMWVEKSVVAGAGFINFILRPLAKSQIVIEVLAAKENFGGKPKESGKKILLEFVSANPTGPLHVGHGRGAAYGASLAALLEFAGNCVECEFYVNDAGRQMDILATSTWMRYQEIFGQGIDFPANAYQGEYVVDMAKALNEIYGEKLLRPQKEWELLLSCQPLQQEDASKFAEEYLDLLIYSAKSLLGEKVWNDLHAFVLKTQLQECRADLEEFGVRYDRWYSERALFDSGAVAKAVESLAKNSFLYQQNGALWFRSTEFGDEKDRVVQRDNGQFTYFASDIAYHKDKFARGYDQIINIWGADHHGYIPRIKGALRAMGLDDKKLEVVLVQFVSLFRDGKKVSMSTRSSEYVTLRVLRNEVGNDACRFFYLLRKSEQALDFDLTLAKSQSNDNPVYYVQYAYTRIASVLRQWDGAFASLDKADVSVLVSPYELDLCSRIASFPELIEEAANNFAPHALVYYLRDLASSFHSLYNNERLLVEDHKLCMARLALAFAVRQTIQNGLRVLGVSCPEVM